MFPCVVTFLRHPMLTQVAFLGCVPLQQDDAVPFFEQDCMDAVTFLRRLALLLLSSASSDTDTPHAPITSSIMFSLYVEPGGSLPATGTGSRSMRRLSLVTLCCAPCLIPQEKMRLNSGSLHAHSRNQAPMKS